MFIPKKPNKNKKKFSFKKKSIILINQHIRFPEVLVIDSGGVNIGVFTTFDAINLAKAQDLDLFCTNPTSKPPTCKIIDYGKFRYEEKKKGKNRKPINNSIKEIRLTINIGQHDFDFKLKNTKEFLQNGHRIKVSVSFRGREMAKTELGYEMLIKFYNAVENFAKIDTPPALLGRFYNMLLVPTAINKPKNVVNLNKNDKIKKSVINDEN